MSTAEIAAALGGRQTGDGWMAHCPAHDDRTPSLSVYDSDGRVLVRCHAGCPQDAVIAALRVRGLWNARSRSGLRNHNNGSGLSRDDGEGRIAPAARLWLAAHPAPGTLAEMYLSSRGIMAELPTTIRFLPQAWNAEMKASLPAMIAAVQDQADRLVGVHRTFLAPHGRDKASVARPKMMLGPCAGAAVRLAQAGSVVAITEGIETGFSVLQATGIPTWAALSAPGIAGLILPARPVAVEVVIFADHDPAGIAAAERAAIRWHGEGRSVRIALPPKAGSDFNDVLRGVA